MSSKFAMAQPIYFIGDRHVLPFSSITFYDERTDTNFRSVTVHRENFRAKEFYDQKIDLGLTATGALLEAGLITKSGIPVHLSPDLDVQAKLIAAGGRQLSPIVVFSMGEQDCISFLRHFDLSRDFRLPDEAPDYGFDETKTEIEFSEITKVIGDILRPAADGFSFLLGLWFNCAMILSLRPPVLDDDLFEASNGFRVWSGLRHKVVWTFNHILKEMLSAKGLAFAFVDLWPAVTDKGFLKPAYELDGECLNYNAACLALEKIVDHAVEIGTPPNFGRFSVAHELASPADTHADSNAVGAAIKKDYDEQLIVTMNVGSEYAQEILGGLVFDHPQCNRGIAFDWTGRNYLRDDTPNLKMAAIPAESMSATYDFFYSDPVRTAVQGILGCDYLVYSVYARKTLVRSPSNDVNDPRDGWHRDGNPAGVVRALLYLTQVTGETAPFQYRKNRKVIEVKGGPGTLILFDGKILEHRATKASHGERIVLDVMFGARVPCIPRMVIHAEACQCPSDPLSFSLERARVFPDIGIREIIADPIRNISNVPGYRLSESISA